jgi:branched-chain amino acid transport system permease protein
MRTKETRIALAAVALVVLAFPLVCSNQYYIHTLFMVFLFATMGLGWNLIGGYGAQLSLGHSTFFAIGAYASVLPMIHSGISPLLGGLLGILLACIAAVVIGLPCFRLRGPYFCLATIAAGEITRTLLLHFQDFTGGANGIPLPYHGTDPLRLQFASKAPYYYLALFLLVVVFSIVRWMEKAKVGRYLSAIREDQDAAESLGIKSDRVKLIAYVISGAVTAACGVLYAFTVGYIDPDSVASVNLSVEIAVVVIVGGIGTLWGPVVGATVIVLLTELTNLYLGSLRSGASLALYGLLLMVVVVTRPAGLISLFDRTKAKTFLKEVAARARSA